MLEGMCLHGEAHILFGVSPLILILSLYSTMIYMYHSPLSKNLRTLAFLLTNRCISAMQILCNISRIFDKEFALGFTSPNMTFVLSRKFKLGFKS